MSINHRIGEHVTRYLVGRDYDVADVQCAKVCYAVESIVGDLQKILFYLLSLQYLDFPGIFVLLCDGQSGSPVSGRYPYENKHWVYSCFGQCVRDRSGGRCTCHISISGRSGIVTVYDVSDGDDRTITIAKSTGLQGRTKKEDSTKRLDRARRIKYLFGDLPCLFHVYCMDFDFTDCGGRSCSDERKLFEL